MKGYEQLAQAIIRHQEKIIGPLAWNEADKVDGLDYTQTGEVVMKGDSKFILEALVRQYEKLFGQASVEACKDAVRPSLKNLQNVDLPEILL